MFEAIRASIAIPGVIAPHVIEGRMLADGGILDPLPIAPIAAVNADLTVAVSVSGQESDNDDQIGVDISPTRERLIRLRRSTSALFERISANPDTVESFEELDDAGQDSADHVDPQMPRLGSFAIMMRTIDIAQAALARHQMAAYPPDILIEVPRTACRSLDFHRSTEVIALGRELAAKALDGLANDSAPVRQPSA